MQTQTPEQAARNLLRNKLQKGFQLEALHEYRNDKGEPIYWKIRCKHPEANDKTVMPMHFSNGKYKLGEPKFPDKKPLYNLSAIKSCQAGETIYITEGEWCADKLIDLGLVATTSGGAQSAHKTDWLPLQNRSIIIWPDNDDSGFKYSESCAKILNQLGCQIQIIDVAALNLPHKGDVVDWLCAHPEATLNDIKALNTLAHQAPTINPPEKKEKKTSVATTLVSLSLKNIDIFQDTNKTTYARSKQTGEICPLESRDFKDSLLASYHELSKSCASKQAIEEAVNTLTAKARLIEPKELVFRRVAQTDDKYYLDLTQPKNSKAIEITSDGWAVIDKPPCNFLRSDTMQPIVAPTPVGDLNLLWKYVNIPNEARILVITWLLECLRHNTPFPILELIGEQGSAKSTTQTVLRRIIDPNSCNLRSAPKNREDIFVSAGLNYLVSYENISHLKSNFQDALCTVATGSGYSTRKYYTNNEEIVIFVKNPIIINGISAAITAQDLVDRTISIELPTIGKRQAMGSIFKDFEQELPMILGGLLNCFTKALSHLPDVMIKNKDQSRLIEFMQLGVAAEKALGLPDRAFISTYQSHRKEAIARTLDTSPVALAVVDHFNQSKESSITDSAKNLFEEIRGFRGGYDASWPKSPKGFADALRRASPALRELGIHCKCLGKRGSYVQWSITKVNTEE